LFNRANLLLICIKINPEIRRNGSHCVALAAHEAVYERPDRSLRVLREPSSRHGRAPERRVRSGGRSPVWL